MVGDADSGTRTVAKAGSAQPRKANFFIVGAPKCGTTAWYEYLRSHPDIYFPNLKEPCFFATDFESVRHVRSEREYSQLFVDGSAAKVIGDASADYLFSDVAANAIRRYNDKAKILILLRDQEEFLPALHNHFLSGFWEEIDDFETAWELSGPRRPETISSACTEPRMLDYAAVGRFHEQVGRYLDNFPRDQIFVIRFRDWVADPRTTYLNILSFLELQDDGRTEFPRLNEGKSYRLRSLVRFFMFPPQWFRKMLRPIKRAIGLESRTIIRQLDHAIHFLSVPGYKKQISEELRGEIRRYYAEDNRLLAARLRDTSGSSDGSRIPAPDLIRSSGA